MNQGRTKKPLYRKLGRTRANTSRGRNPKLKRGWQRGTKRGISAKMTSHDNPNRGYSFNPLYRFLESKVGCDWNDVYSECIYRLEPEMYDEIYTTVDESFTNPMTPMALLGRKHFYMLFIDDNNVLQRYLGHPDYKGFNSEKEFLKWVNS